MADWQSITDTVAGVMGNLGICAGVVVAARQIPKAADRLGTAFARSVAGSSQPPAEPSGDEPDGEA